MHIIDPHTHVWTNDPAFPWPAENDAPPVEDRTAEMLLSLMDRYGVEKTVLVQYIGYRWDCAYVSHVLRAYPDRFAGVCRVDPEDPAAPDHLGRWVEEHGFQGVRLSPAEGPAGDWFRGPLMAPIFRRAQELAVPLLMLTRPGRLPDLANLLERFPDLDVVIDHMADAQPGRPEEIQAVLDLARYPRVFVKISHTWSISHQDYPWSDTHAMVKAVYQAFGGHRIMWGTDWPVCLAKAAYGQTLSVVRDEMTFIAPADMPRVLGGTALDLWTFEEPKT